MYKLGKGRERALRSFFCKSRRVTVKVSSDMPRRSRRGRAQVDETIEEDPDRTGRSPGRVEEDGDETEEIVLSQENAQMLRVVRSELQRSLEAATAEITNRVKGKIAFLECKSEINERPVFKSKANEKHFERSQRYLSFILEVKTALSEGDTHTGLCTWTPSVRPSSAS